MKKAMRKWGALSMAVVLSMALMTACGNSDSSSDTDTSDSSTLNGMVKSVDGTTITLAVMQGGGQGGQRPDGQKPDEQKNNGKQDNKDGTQKDNQQPQGTPPADAGNGKNVSGGGIDANAETKTITLSNRTKVTIQEGDSTSEGSSSDITTGSRITAVMDGDTATEITVQKMSRNQDNNQK